MAGAKSGKAPGKIFAPGGSEVFSDEGRDYFTDKGFTHEGSFDQVKRRWEDVDRLQNIKREERAPKRYDDGGIVNKPGQVVRTRRQEQERREAEDKRDRNIMSYELDYYKGKADLPTSQRAPYVTPVPKFYKGGSVKHGSSTCVKSRVKG